MASAGAFHGYGVVYKLDHSGQTVLHTFTEENDGKKPGGKLIRDADGNLYGMASGGKQVCGTPPGCGLIFRLAPNPDGSWTETVLHYFTGGADGAFPAGIVRDPLGNLYGITNAGGAGYGVVYKLDATGNQTVLYSFSGGEDGASPSGLLRDDDGTLYGTTSDGGTYDLGTVFKISSN
jgi:uncharacterized repeat protein (TIGR03803 family)